MIHRIFIAFIVILSVIVSILALTLPPDQMLRLSLFNAFFQVSLPILAFGALIKYLCSCKTRCCCGDDSCPPPRM